MCPERLREMVLWVFCGPLRDVDMQLQLILPWKRPPGIMLDTTQSQMLLPQYVASIGVLAKSVLTAITDNSRISMLGMAKGFRAHIAVQCD